SPDCEFPRRLRSNRLSHVEAINKRLCRLRATGGNTRIGKGKTKMLNYRRYRKNPVVDYPEREWPNKEIEKAPIWCSVDLRDGNQALIDPMIVEEKVEMFLYLIRLGFKEIEIGFPAASQIEFDFLRQLVDRKLIRSEEH